ncbi:MAG: hypothetical protein EXR76_10490 [Myxococcales bacterium]|nr:hypothetical protein [Myxococcales bacterium]
MTPSSVILLDAAINAQGFVVGIALSPKHSFSTTASELVGAASKNLLPYCKYTGVMILGDTIFYELDTFMLGISCDEQTFGVYRCAWTYALVLGFLNMSVSNVLFPKVTQVSDTAELRAFMRRIVKFTGLLAVATLPALPIVSFWIPHYEPRYADAVPVFMLMYVGIVFELVVGPLSYVLYSLDRPGVLAFNAVLKIGLNFGATAATVATRILGGLFALYLVNRTLRLRETEATQR